ncbi:hypothetical protein [Actinoplanes sp. NPDC051411]|uniref:hypothetical protein n=1 Tax=Actinoplanes sp. NPDC051411 TaxID=3155522 RepID=UPI0034187A50
MVAATGLALLSACDPSQAATKAGASGSTPNWAGEFSPNCSGGTPTVRYSRFDINNDGALDWFYVFRCPEAFKTKPDRGDQLEVLDGKGDQDHPRRLGYRRPLIHSDERRDILDGCLMFSYQRVHIAVSGGPVLIGTWQPKGVLITRSARAEDLPCQEIRWEGDK